MSLDLLSVRSQNPEEMLNLEHLVRPAVLQFDNQVGFGGTLGDDHLSFNAKFQAKRDRDLFGIVHARFDPVENGPDETRQRLKESLSIGNSGLKGQTTGLPKSFRC